MAEVSDVEDGQNELDVGVVTNAVGERKTASLASAALVASTEAAVEHSVRDGSTVLDFVQIALVGLELGDGDDFLRGEDGELDVLAADGRKRVSVNIEECDMCASAPTPSLLHSAALSSPAKHSRKTLLLLRAAESATASTRGGCGTSGVHVEQQNSCLSRMAFVPSALFRAITAKRSAPPLGRA